MVYLKNDAYMDMPYDQNTIMEDYLEKKALLLLFFLNQNEYHYK